MHVPLATASGRRTLIDSLNGIHLWAGCYDGEIHDAFDLQDPITRFVPIAEGAKRLPSRRLA